MQRGILNSSTPPTGITGTPAREMDYTLDITGNWTNYLTKTSGTTDLDQTRTSNAVNEITAIGAGGGTPVWTTPTYDPAGNMNSMPWFNNITVAMTATYDAWNRMTSCTVTGTVMAAYQYDGRNRKITSTDASSTTRHFYYTSNWQNIEERSGTSTSPENQYVWGIRYIDELICRDDATPTRNYACQDANFNVTCVTNSSGTVQVCFAYDPYGWPQEFDGGWAGGGPGVSDWRPGFQGLFYDFEAGLIYNRNRIQNPTMGVFTTMDPIGYVDGSNLYSYLNNAPITNTDSLGFAANVPLTDPTITSISIDDLNDSDSASYFAANFITSKNWGRTQELGNWNDENGIITFTGKIITSQIRLTVHCCSDQALLEAIDAFNNKADEHEVAARNWYQNKFNQVYSGTTKQVSKTVGQDKTAMFSGTWEFSELIEMYVLLKDALEKSCEPNQALITRIDKEIQNQRKNLASAAKNAWNTLRNNPGLLLQFL